MLTKMFKGFAPQNLKMKSFNKLAPTIRLMELKFGSNIADSSMYTYTYYRYSYN